MNKKPRLLDLFCGAGGASVGYNRAGFEVVGVDIKPQPRYPFEFHQADALEYPLEGFDCYHASPPCQRYCDNNISRDTDHPDLIEPTRQRLIATGQVFVMENVQLAPLNAGLMLCGTMFGLRVIRHRYFEFNPGMPPPFPPYTCNHWGKTSTGEFAAVYGRGGKGRRYIDFDEDGKLVRKRIGRAPGPTGRELFLFQCDCMGIDWMKTTKELTESIPPAYTEFIGKYLKNSIG